MRAVDGVSLSIARGEVLALLGPSGSGKTTLLRLLGGFEFPDQGSIELEDREMTPLPPEKRRFGMVFQHYALFPHLNVNANIAFGLGRQAETSKEKQVQAALELVGLKGYGEREISELSGGQQQRIALARALAFSPAVLLLDEPLSNLDPELREKTRRALRKVMDQVGLTTVIVTHEQEEAFDLGDRVAVMREGRLEQVGTPQELYEQPQTPFVSRFIGRSSILRGTMTPEGAVRVGEHLWRANSHGGLNSGQDVELHLRPEALEIVGRGEGLPGRVKRIHFRGALQLVDVEIDGQAILELSSRQPPIEGAEVGVRQRDGRQGVWAWALSHNPSDPVDSLPSLL